jgi:hypothetical protein
VGWVQRRDRLAWRGEWQALVVVGLCDAPGLGRELLLPALSGSERGSYSSLTAAAIWGAAQGRDSVGRPITSDMRVFLFLCILIRRVCFYGSSLLFLFLFGFLLDLFPFFFCFSTFL